VTKHPVFLEQEQRGIVLDAIRHISFVHLADIATVEVLRLLQPKFYIKGNDWVARGGVPEAEATVCAEFGIEVVYLPTVTNSSSKILKAWANQTEMKSQ
jgi:bifunctional ADP-heptose synthase (sugar kinase/adenylyltransferase)